MALTQTPTTITFRGDDFHRHTFVALFPWQSVQTLGQTLLRQGDPVSAVRPSCSWSSIKMHPHLTFLKTSQAQLQLQFSIFL